ncbi:MAG: hypothetical protein KDA57_20945 [Planctomycetales bacterium]|nr:hypothetical protein [Planctomycetales bacterium]
MPTHLRISLAAYLLSHALWVAVEPFTEWGFLAVLVVSTHLVFASVAIAFMLRRRGSWQYMKWFAICSIGINAFLFPTQELYGTVLPFAILAAALEGASACGILWSILRRADTAAWFHARAAG